MEPGIGPEAPAPSRQLPASLVGLAAELKAYGLAVEPSPDADHLRVEGRFGVRIDRDPHRLTAWLDGDRMGWIARFDDVERLTVALRRIRGLRRRHWIGTSLMGAALLGLAGTAYGDALLERMGLMGPVALVLVLTALVGWLLVVRSRRTMRRLGEDGKALAWEREGAIAGRTHRQTS